MFSLTDGQSSFLTDGQIVHSGNFAIEVYVDHVSGLEFMNLLEVIDTGVGFDLALDEYGTPFATPLSSALFPTLYDLEFYLNDQDLHPIGFVGDVHGGASDLKLLPIVRTGESFGYGYAEVLLTAEILNTGNTSILERGFLVSDSLNFEFPMRYPIDSFADSADSYFEMLLSEHVLSSGMTYYFKAYAINEIGEVYGAVKKVQVMDSFDGNGWKAHPELEGGWRDSWFGAYLLTGNNWMYHADLGWLYYTPGDHNSWDGNWLWSEQHGWLWVREDTWPFIYSHDSGSWLYFLKSIEGTPIFYNYESRNYEYAPF